MPLLNYTTTIKPERTAGEIQGKLAKAGASKILIEYGRDGYPTGLSFIIDTQFGPRPFKLPVVAEPVYAVLRKQYSNGQVPKRYVDMAQARRVAWRITKDWLDAQLALIETEMVPLEQVMLPYMTTDTGKTVFEALKDSQLKLPAGSDPHVIEATEVSA
jgi:hypothetical protein